MNKIILTSFVFLSTFFGQLHHDPSASGAVTSKYVITHFNIIFAPDLSNRMNPNLYRRPLQDLQLLQLLTGDLWPSILRHGNRMEGQQDKLLVDFVNKSLISQYHVNSDKLFIDFGPSRFKNQSERINYIMKRAPAKRFMEQDIRDMLAEFRRVGNYAAKENFGADIWSYFNQGIDERKVLTSETVVSDGRNTYINNFRNILILPTDGYIEAGIFGKGFDLSKHTIDAFREAYLNSKETDLRQFFKKNKQYRIRPVNNPNLKNLEVLIMELYDRSLGKGGQATVQPTDMEIMRLFWEDWLKQSGVKRFELQPYAASVSEAENIILKFMGVQK